MGRTPFDSDPAGWYLDPTGRARLRFWDGRTLTAWVSDGVEVQPDPVPDELPEIDRQDADHLAFVREVFIPQARRRGLVGHATADTLTELAWSSDVTARVPAAAATASATLTATPLASPPASAPERPYVVDKDGLPYVARSRQSDGRTTSPERPHGESPDARPATTHEPAAAYERPPSRLDVWWSQTRESIGSDVATHGLAYLGVLLLFVGVFGLVAFAFGDVAQGMRPVAELGIAFAPFLASWMLLRRGATVAGRALELAGGLLLPVMVVTSFLDGVPIPPDLTGPGLVVTLTLVTALVGAGYALWSLRHHHSALRYLVAPVAWVSVALATMGIGRAIPEGKDVATFTAWQVAAVTVAMALSLAWARWRPAATLSAPTITAGVPGACIVAALALLTWVTGGYPRWPVLLTGVAGLLVLELLDVRVPARVVGVAQVAWWGVVFLALLPGAGSSGAELATGALVAGAGFLALVELHGRSTDPLPVSLSALGLVAAFAVTWADPWYAFAASVVLALWAGARRLHPYVVAYATQVLDVAAALLPVAAVVAVGLATRHAPLAVLVGSLLVLAAVIPIRVPVVRAALHRDESDHFWTLWWDPAMVAASAAVLILTTQFWPDVASARWMSVAAPLALAISAALGPLPRSWRAWPTVALATWSWWLGATLVGTSTAVLGGVPAAVALGILVVVHVRPTLVDRWSDPGGLGLAAHVLALTAVSFADVGTRWTVAVLVTAATAGFVLTAVYQELGRSPVSDRLVDWFGSTAREATVVLCGLMLPLSLALVLDAADLVPIRSSWFGVVASGVAVFYAAATHVAAPARVRATLVWLAISFSVLAFAAIDTRGPALAALAAVIVVAVILRPSPQVAQWLGWSAVAPAVALAATYVVASYEAASVVVQVALALAVVGGPMLLAALAYDSSSNDVVRRLLPTTGWLRPPAVVGAVEIAVAAALTPELDVWWAGWITVTTALVVAASAWLLRIWSLLGAAALVAWVGAWQLWPDALTHSAWVGVVVAALLLAAYEAAWRLDRSSPAWARADYPLLAVAHITAITAVITAREGTSLALTLLAVGALAGVLAVSFLRRPAVDVVVPSGYAVLSGSLIVAAGAVEGYGWLALALALVSVACSVVALRVGRSSRWVLVTAGSMAALGAWLAFASWLELGDVAKVSWTSAIAAVVVLVSAGLLRWTNADRDVLLVRATVGLATLTMAAPLAAALASASTIVPYLSWVTVAALVVAAVALGLVATRLTWAWLRYAAAAYLLLSVVVGLVVAHATASAQVGVLGALSMVVAGALLVHDRLGSGEWLMPAAAFGAWTTLATLGAAALELPDAWLVPVALVVAAVYSAALGRVLASIGLTLLAPALACAAWITWAAQSLDGNPQWYTVAVGLTLLVMIAMLRGWRRRNAQPVDTPDVVWLEVVGVAFLVCSSFVQIFTVSLGYAALAAAIGIGVAAWGVVTRVRRRLALGAAVTVAALALLVLVPVAQMLPAWSGATLWVSIATLGLVAIVVATMLEQGKAVVRREIGHLRALTEGWE